VVAEELAGEYLDEVITSTSNQLTIPVVARTVDVPLLSSTAALNKVVTCLHTKAT
jgi:hypothetical protein